MNILLYFILGNIFGLLLLSKYTDHLSEKDNVMKSLLNAVYIRFNELRHNEAEMINAESLDIVIVPTEQYDRFEEIKKYLPGLTNNDKVNLFKFCSIIPYFSETFLAGKEMIIEAFDDMKRNGYITNKFDDNLVTYLVNLSENPFAKSYVEGFLMREHKNELLKGKKTNGSKKKSKKATNSK